MLSNIKQQSFLYALAECKIDDYILARKILNRSSYVRKALAVSISSLGILTLLGLGWAGIIVENPSSLKLPATIIGIISVLPLSSYLLKKYSYYYPEDLPGDVLNREHKTAVSRFIQTHQLSVPERQLRNAIQQLIWIKEPPKQPDQSPKLNLNP